jgi:hypothetical protein
VVEDLPLAAGPWARLHVRQHPPGRGYARRRGAVQGEVGPEQPGEDEVRIGRHGCLGVGHRFTAQPGEAVDGPVEEGDAFEGACLQRSAPSVGEHGAHQASPRGSRLFQSVSIGIIEYLMTMLLVMLSAHFAAT